MAFCIGSKCSKKELCRKYVNHASAGIHNIVDWSTMGYGEMSGWGHLFNFEQCCGDNANDYYKFEPLEENNGKD